jgi:hypothetical protein
MTRGHRDVYCQELAALIAACDTEDPDPDLLAQIEAHIDECDICESAEAALTQKVQVFRSAEPAVINSAFESEMVNRLCHKAPKRDDPQDR